MTTESPPDRLVEQVKYCDEVPGAQYPAHTWGGREDLIAPLVAVADSFDDPQGRSNAAKALGYIGGDRAFEALCDCLREDESPAVRNAAAWGLRSLGSADAVPRLKEVVQTDTDADVRGQAARALAVLNWDGKPAYAAQLLREGDDRCWEGFSTELGKQSVPNRDAVRERLANLPEETLGDDQLARLLRALGRFEAFTDRIAAYLDHEKAQLRAAAIDGLAGHDDAPLGRVVSLGRDDPAPEVRRAAVDAFGSAVGESGHVPHSKIAQFVDDEAATVRAEAFHKLRFADPPDNVPTLVEGLEDPDPSVRARAAWSLKVVAFPGAVPALLGAYPDQDETVREYIIRALQWIAGDMGRSDASGFALLEDTTVPSVDGSQTRSYEPVQALDVLVTALRDSEEAVSRETAATLAQTDHREAARVLAEFVTDETCVPQHRAHGVWHLRQLRQFEASGQAYHTALTDDEPAVRRAAVSIARGMNEETTAVLVDALSDPAAEVRKTAAEEARHHDAAQLDEELRTHLETETDEQVVFALRRALDAF